MDALGKLLNDQQYQQENQNIHQQQQQLNRGQQQKWTAELIHSKVFLKNSQFLRKDFN